MGTTTHEASPAQLFETVWQDVETVMGPDGMRFPDLVIWLGGAPGAGKGTQTENLMKVLGMTTEPIVMSSLLTSPEMEALKAAGNLCGDRDVLGLLFKALIDPSKRQGVIVDGFPRTTAQSECVVMLYEKMLALHQARPDHFPDPDFQIVLFSVPEEIAIERQIMRGRKTIAHNKQVEATGEGELKDVRPTDVDPALAAKRFRQYEGDTAAALYRLARWFPFKDIDASGTIPTVERLIRESFAPNQP